MRGEEVSMRVLINASAAAGTRTGIGHYTKQLVRCLRAQAAADEVRCFPSGLVRKARAVWTRVRPWLAREGRPRPTITVARQEIGVKVLQLVERLAHRAALQIVASGIERDTSAVDAGGAGGTGSSSDGGSSGDRS